MRLEKAWFVLEDDGTVLDVCDDRLAAIDVMRRLAQSRQAAESQPQSSGG